jgi:hypothetical protein
LHANAIFLDSQILPHECFTQGHRPFRAIRLLLLPLPRHALEISFMTLLMLVSHLWIPWRCQLPNRGNGTISALNRQLLVDIACPLNAFELISVIYFAHRLQAILTDHHRALLLLEFILHFQQCFDQSCVFS